MTKNIDNLDDFGLNVRTLRTARGLSLNDLAVKCGLHRNYISDLELGKRNVSFESIKKISDGLELPMKDLFVMK